MILIFPIKIYAHANNVRFDGFPGRAVYFAANGASEERTYVDNIPHGPATLYLTSGDTEERTYENGQLHGIATFVSNNGDRYVMP